MPDDLSIIGFDNISLTEYCDPPLTTVAQPRFDIGREAMLLLLDQLGGKMSAAGHVYWTVNSLFGAPPGH